MATQSGRWTVSSSGSASTSSLPRAERCGRSLSGRGSRPCSLRGAPSRETSRCSSPGRRPSPCRTALRASTGKPAGSTGRSLLSAGAMSWRGALSAARSGDPGSGSWDARTTTAAGQGLSSVRRRFSRPCPVPGTASASVSASNASPTRLVMSQKWRGYNSRSRWMTNRTTRLARLQRSARYEVSWKTVRASPVSRSPGTLQV